MARNTLLGLLAAPLALFGQYQAETIAAPPPELARNRASGLQPGGFKITRDGKPYCEIWFRAKAPAGTGSEQRNATLSFITAGALLGVIRFDQKGEDRRGQSIPAGLYTLRYGIMPMNSMHEGAAPHRDFLLLSPAADDRDPDSLPGFDALVQMSRTASGTKHPAILSFWKAAADSSGFGQQGDDWVLQAKIGDIPVMVILIGTAGF